MFRQDFTADFNAIVEAQGPFGFIRFGDGELALIQNRPYQAASGWGSSKSSWMRKELASILQHPPSGLAVGISSPCCQALATMWYRDHVGVQKNFLTFASLFSHRNYSRFREITRRYEGACIVAPKNGDFEVPLNGVQRRWDLDGLVDRLLKVDRPIFVAAGPCANLIIARYWKRQTPEKRQTILDVGAALDRKIHGKTMRAYNQKQRHVCRWDEWHPFGITKKKRVVAVPPGGSMRSTPRVIIGERDAVKPKRNRKSGGRRASEGVKSVPRVVVGERNVIERKRKRGRKVSRG